LADQEELDRNVRRAVYDTAMTRGRIPTIAEIASSLGLPDGDARTSVRRLADAHILVLQENGEILMAAPFSAVPTSFLVRTRSFQCFANCVWDAMGIPVMAGTTATVETACGCCGNQMILQLDGGLKGEGIVHFAVPARQWWDNIVFT
jgi:alkylmercury lyase-like protein